MRRLKVAIVAQHFSPILPPVEHDSISIWTYQVARRLAGECDVVIFSPEAPGAGTGETVFESVRYVYVPQTADYLINKAHGLALRMHRAAGFAAKPDQPRFASRFHHAGYGAWIARRLRRERCDVVHLHNFTQHIPMIRLLNPGIKIVIHMHCQWLTQLDRRLVGRRLQHVDKIVACSNFIRDRISIAFPEYAERCCTIYNGVDTARYSPGRPISSGRDSPGGDQSVVFVGRISPEKGIHILLDAFRAVAATHPRARLVLVGPACSADREFIVTLSNDEGVADLADFYPPGAGLDYYGNLMRQRVGSYAPALASRVEFVGAVPHSALADIYRNADIVVNSSLSEAFPLPVVEAMASGVPVVASRVGGIPEAVANHRSGIVVEPGATEQLAGAVSHLLADAALRSEMGAEGRRKALELFSWDRIAQSIYEVYGDTCAEPEPLHA